MSDVQAPETVPVWVALSRVQADLPAIGKADRNTSEGFNFRSSEAINRVLSPLLAKHGVVIVPRSQIVDVRASPAMKEGWSDVFLTVDWTIYGPDGTNIAARTNGIGRDKVDRGANKAATQAYKYLVLQLFGIADKDDDSDGQSYEHERAAAYVPSAEAVALHAELDGYRNTPIGEALKALAIKHTRRMDPVDLEDSVWRQEILNTIDAAKADTEGAAT